MTHIILVDRSLVHDDTTASEHLLTIPHPSLSLEYTVKLLKNMYRKENRWFIAAIALFCLLQNDATYCDTVNTCDSSLDGQSDTCLSKQETTGSINTQKMNEKQWKWIPQAEHPCNIVRMTQDELFSTFGPMGLPSLHPEPIVIVGSQKNAKFREMTSQVNITKSLPPNFNITLSSSNSFSAHRRTIPLTQYLEEISQNDAITTPDQLSNETWYLFGETYMKEWQSLFEAYELPTCHSCYRNQVALSFGIGNRGSGVQWHVHGPGFSEALHGRKHWVLYPHKPVYNPDKLSRHWMEYTYTSLAEKDLPYECTLEPGDAIYFPNGWYHATINLDRYTAFVSTFTIEHL